MSDGIAAFGDVKFSGVFSWENNELHRTVYLQDPQKQLVPLMLKLFGEQDFPQGHQFPAPFDTFHAMSATFSATSERGTQSDTTDQGDFDILDVIPLVRGGMTIDVTYRPIDNSGYNPVTEEAWDFSSQTMSMVGNNFGSREGPGTRNLRWETSYADNPGQRPYVTNITSIIKVIPKVELMQRKIWCQSIPADWQRNCIGRVNEQPLQMGAKGHGNKEFWPAGTVLLMGLPTIRRWRFDGLQLFEIGVKLAVNTYKAKIETGEQDYVTWNRLYRHEVGCWDKILCGPDDPNDPDATALYRPDDLSSAIDGFS